MYRYDEFDAEFVRQRVAQFRDQVERRVKGELTEDEFRPLRLMNGLYLQLHAYMLRIAVPYGTLSSRQMRKLAHIARAYDRGYGHFTTRQNLQFNWPALGDIPDILAELAEVEMHAIQTSGNCIRNVTADHFAGATAEEVADPRPYAEIIRQWSSLHPEFSFLPRKFKVAVTAAERDRAAIQVHDIGLHLKRLADGGLGFAVWVGGGQGRTPLLAKKIRDDLPEADLLSYLEAVLRIYNLHGRRDNKYKARIKILVHEIGADAFRRAGRGGVAAHPRGRAQAARRTRSGASMPTSRRPPSLRRPPALPPGRRSARPMPAFERWIARNTHAHKQRGYAIVTISLKPIGGVPGDASAAQMDAVADLAERYSFDEVRVTHEQNLVLPHVRLADLRAVYDALVEIGLAEANAGLVTDIIACPGLDYCALANARSIPIAQRISERLAARQDQIGDLKIKISGCINACGHHHVGHIGILGVEKRGEEHYQLLLGGSGAEDAALAAITGPGFGPAGIVDAVEKVVDTYLKLRTDPQEAFLSAYGRLGPAPFKEALYAVPPLPACPRAIGSRPAQRPEGLREEGKPTPPSMRRPMPRSGRTARFSATHGRRRSTVGRCPSAPVILSKKRWLVERDTLAGRNIPLGLKLEPGEPLGDIAGDLAQFSVIALNFPKFSDGRAFSTATLLREKHAFKGELRAVGNVLSDQIPLMRRVGFDTFEVTHAPTRRALLEGRIAEVRLHYQPAVVTEPPAGTRPWLRRTSG